MLIQALTYLCVGFILGLPIAFVNAICKEKY